MKIALDVPLQHGEAQVCEITLREPKAGELRGLKLVDLTQLDVDAWQKFLPRISELTMADVANLTPADFLKITTEGLNFFLPKTSQMT